MNNLQDILVDIILILVVVLGIQIAAITHAGAY